jgi:predicted unusual protein kinase regulating ubiquinone biosynthesis (AarF/ABC1/UbiB family)
MYELSAIHVDLHYGNIYWNTVHKKLVIFDFAVILEFKPEMMQNMIEMNFNFCFQRYREAARNHLQLMFANYHELSKDEIYYNELISYVENIMSSAQGLSFQTIQQINNINVSHKNRTIAKLNDGINSYELFIAQCHKIMQLLDEDANLYQSVFARSASIVMQRLGKKNNLLPNPIKEVFLSI